MKNSPQVSLYVILPEVILKGLSVAAENHPDHPKSLLEKTWLLSGRQAQWLGYYYWELGSGGRSESALSGAGGCFCLSLTRPSADGAAGSSSETSSLIAAFKLPSYNLAATAWANIGPSGSRTWLSLNRFLVLVLIQI